ncbi:Helicase C-terminal [Penicillium waksmanii]|uniref:Helicase C-terminal n=1 Tax=Penicillium waksmanii TaxID=69791 RepID=UPI002548F8E3|nr:Helicase C-terminal [Penicillium waksmanii]KAJ5965844.1 Helicase C-terminal [Penicillium waksmanii]
MTSIMDEYDQVPGALEDVSNVHNSDYYQDPREEPETVAELKPPMGSEDRHEEVRKQGWTDRVAIKYDEVARNEDYEWAGGANRYEWAGEEGDIGPRNEELEEQLFKNINLSRVGHRIEEYKKIQVTFESEERIYPTASWEAAKLHPVLIENLTLCLYQHPTPIQCYVIPSVLSGKDVIGIAQTGSGKTGAFLIPILSQLMGKAKKLAAPRPNVSDPNFDLKSQGVRAEPLVLIVCPTRELATQIFDEARRLCYRSMLRPCVVYGGAPSRYQRDELRKGCDILIGTTGRITDFMSQPNVLSLRRVRYTVIDEADEMLQSDWEDEFKKIMSGGDVNEDEDHRYLMFSATFNKQCRKLAREYLSTDHIRIRVGRPGSSHLNVSQVIHFVEDRAKKRAVFDLLLSMVPIRTLIFANNKTTVDYLDDYLYNSGLPTTSIHSDRTQREREDAIRSFKIAECPILIATGVTARGLDIANVMHVINYDLPTTTHGGITEYVHRIGRTARIGNEGIATSFYNERNEDLGPDLVKILLECKQTVPDFLEHFTPSEGKLTFDDDVTDDEDNNENEDAGQEEESAENAATTEDHSLYAASEGDPIPPPPEEAPEDANW